MSFNKILLFSFSESQFSCSNDSEKFQFLLLENIKNSFLFPLLASYFYNWGKQLIKRKNLSHICSHFSKYPLCLCTLIPGHVERLQFPTPHLCAFALSRSPSSTSLTHPHHLWRLTAAVPPPGSPPLIPFCWWGPQPLSPGISVHTCLVCFLHFSPQLSVCV